MSMVISEVNCRVIKRILQTPWLTQDGVTSCRVFILLENMVCFELEPLLTDIRDGSFNLEKANTAIQDLVDVEFGIEGLNRNGSLLLDVVYCDYWPSLGAVIKTNSTVEVLCCKDWGAPFDKYGAFLIDSRDISTGDVFSYWTHTSTKAL